MTCSAVKAKGAGLGNKWILILHPSLPLTPLNLMLLRKANPTKTRVGRVEDTRDIADPASKEESFNFHYADHMYIPLHPSCLRGLKRIALLSGLFFRKHISFCSSTSCFRRIDKEVRRDSCCSSLSFEASTH
jgi:hypothetical protein